MVSSLFLFLALLSLLFAVDARPSPSLSRASHQRHQHQRHRHHQTQPNFTEVDTIIASLKQQVVSDDADLIIDTLVNGAYKGVTYDRLANFTDTIGPRVCGSETLEGAVQFMIDRLTEDGLENVHAEQGRYTAPHKQRRARVAQRINSHRFTHVAPSVTRMFFFSLQLFFLTGLVVVRVLPSSLLVSLI